ncbi:hypothetical protein CI610_02639 [invertebrate metagenome]|uniref:Uncharacterized protein n=1 Tax=invertebrate metagenome TaxID=1711999 RepID=A0A2H9T5E0_9ZZZZ
MVLCMEHLVEIRMAISALTARLCVLDNSRMYVEKSYLLLFCVILRSKAVLGLE